VSVLDDDNQSSECCRDREQVECDGLHGREDRSEPAEQGDQRATTTSNITGGKRSLIIVS